MNKEEVLKMVDSLQREWEVDREIVFSALEEAFTLAIRKHLRIEQNLRVEVDQGTGQIRAFGPEEELDLSGLGRVAYQFAKQRFVQLLKEAKDKDAYEAFNARQGSIAVGNVIRVGNEVVTLRIDRRIEGILPPREQIPGETYTPGGVVKAYVREVERRGGNTRIILSRSCDEFVGKLFEREVPEIQNGTCVVRGIARDPGYRSKILVESTRENVDCVGACVGVGRGRVKNIVAELNGENLDIIPWSADEKERVRFSMKPAEITEIRADEAKRHATLYVRKGELSQAIGKGGRNVRLASRLTGWEIDVFEQPDEIASPEIATGRPAAEGGTE